MSVELMGRVWKYKFTKAEQSILLAMADHAKEDGSDCFASVSRLAWKTDYSERQVQRTQKDLTKRGILTVVHQARRGRGIEYKINLHKAEPKPEYTPVRGDTMSPYQVMGDTMSPQRKRGDTMSPQCAKGVTFEANMGDILGERGDIAMSPESLTINNQKQIDHAESDFWLQCLTDLAPSLPAVAGARLEGSHLEPVDDNHFQIIVAPHVTSGLDWLNQQAAGAIGRALSVTFRRRIEVEIVAATPEKEDL